MSGYRSERNIYTQEHLLVAAEVLSRLDKGESPPLSPEAIAMLGHILREPSCLRGVNPEDAYVPRMMWRLGVACKMSQLVLKSVADTIVEDVELSVSTLSMAGTEIASELLEAEPYLLRDFSSKEIAAFWELMLYSPEEDILDEPEDLIEALTVLQYAAYLPDAVIDQIRRYRDHTSTMHHKMQVSAITAVGEELSVEAHEPSERAKELAEATMRVTLGVFVARYTQSPEDRHFATTAVRDATFRMLTDIEGVVSALQLVSHLDDLGTGKSPEGREMMAQLRESIINKLPTISLANISLYNLILLAGRVHDIVREAVAPQLDTVLCELRAKLEEYELLYAVSDGAHLVYSDEKAAAIEDKMRNSQSGTVQAAVEGTLRVLRDEVTREPTPEDILAALTENHFSPQLVQEAFDVVGGELDPARKAELLQQFDTAIGQVLEGAEVSDMKILAEIASAKGFEAFTRFPRVRRWLAARTLAFAESVQAAIGWPEASLHRQEYPDVVVARCLALLQKAFEANRYYYFHEINDEKVAAFAAMRKTYEIGFQFMRKHEVQMETQELISRIAYRTALLWDDFAAAFHHYRLHIPWSEPEPWLSLDEPPIEQMLGYYYRRGSRVQNSPD